jgi:hypothetical protein
VRPEYKPDSPFTLMLTVTCASVAEETGDSVDEGKVKLQRFESYNREVWASDHETNELIENMPRSGVDHSHIGTLATTHVDDNSSSSMVRSTYVVNLNSLNV